MRGKGFDFNGQRLDFIKIATAEEWESENPVLDVGLFGYDTDNKITKIGDGKTAWTELAGLAVEKPKPPLVYGVRINQSLYEDPSAWVTYTDDCVGFEPASMDINTGILTDNGWLDRFPFNQIRPCVIKDGQVVGYLKKDNYKEFEDGTPSNNTSKDIGDVMVEFPKMYFRIAKDPNTGEILLNISDKKLDGYTGDAFVYKGKEYDKLYMSAYLCGESSLAKNGFQSVAGITALGSAKELTDYYNALSVIPRENFDFITYQQMYLIQILYVIMFKTTRTDETYTSTSINNSSIIKNGSMDDKGMYYGIKSANSQAENKLFGLENFFGAKYQLAVGFAIKDGVIYVADPHNPDTTYDLAGEENFKPLEVKYALSTTTESVAIDINGDNYTGFFNVGDDPSKYTEISNVGFCDMSSQMINSSYIIFGLSVEPSKSHKNDSGIFSMHAVGGKSLGTTTARLVYYPVNKS